MSKLKCDYMRWKGDVVAQTMLQPLSKFSHLGQARSLAAAAFEA